MAHVFNPFTGQIDTVADPLDVPFTFEARCSVTESVSQCVSMLSSVTGSYVVRRANINDVGSMPAIGVIIAKSGDSNCTVAYFGHVSASGLTPGRTCYVGSGSSMTTTRPDGLVYIQAIGAAKTTSSILLNPSYTETGISSLSVLLTEAGTVVYVGEGDILVQS